MALIKTIENGIPCAVFFFTFDDHPRKEVKRNMH